MQQRAPIDSATTDATLAEAFAAREPGALEEAYARHVDVLYAVARGVLGGTQDAQDCVHDVVLRTGLTTHGFRVERGTLRSFLIVCVRNEALTRRRNAARRADIERRAASLDPQAAERIEDLDPVLQAKLRAALDSLPREQRAAIDLAYSGDKTQSQIATQLGIPLGTVKGRISLALRKLAIALGPSES